jgi:hypothetical protein
MPLIARCADRPSRSKDWPATQPTPRDSEVLAYAEVLEKLAVNDFEQRSRSPADRKAHAGQLNHWDRKIDLTPDEGSQVIPAQGNEVDLV